MHDYLFIYSLFRCLIFIILIIVRGRISEKMKKYTFLGLKYIDLFSETLFNISCKNNNNSALLYHLILYELGRFWVELFKFEAHLNLKDITIIEFLRKRSIHYPYNVKLISLFFITVLYFIYKTLYYFSSYWKTRQVLRLLQLDYYPNLHEKCFKWRQ